MSVILAGAASAEIRLETVEYQQGDTVLEGVLAYDPTMSSTRPGIVVVHDWMGVSDYVKDRARQLAELGYVVLAADIYGKGVRPETREAAAAEAGKYRADRALLRARVRAAVDVLKKRLEVDPTRIAAIGYCFGGGTVLELARDGADIAGVVSFHGNLDTPNPADAKNIKAKVLVLHGADDPHVPPAQVTAFQEEMRTAGVDWQLVMYGGAVHSFSNPGAGSDYSQGNAYNEKADKRSWIAMKDFFKELFER